MLTDFNSLPTDAKIYIYPSSKKFYKEQLDEIDTKVKVFVEDWSEKHNLTSSYTIKYSRFIIFGIDSEASIDTVIVDSLVGFILSLQNDYDLELLDKLNVCFKQGEYVQYKETKAFKTLIKNRGVNENSIVFDNLITTKEELEHSWELPAKDTWYSRMF